MKRHGRFVGRTWRRRCPRSTVEATSTHRRQRTRHLIEIHVQSRQMPLSRMSTHRHMRLGSGSFMKRRCSALALHPNPKSVRERQVRRLWCPKWRGVGVDADPWPVGRPRVAPDGRHADPPSRRLHPRHRGLRPGPRPRRHGTALHGESHAAAASAVRPGQLPGPRDLRGAPPYPAGVEFPATPA